MDEWTTYECCPHCDEENEIVGWNPSLGYEFTCQRCGKKLMLCAECHFADDNKEKKCDWHPGDKGEGICFRMKGE